MGFRRSSITISRVRRVLATSLILAAAHCVGMSASRAKADDNTRWLVIASTDEANAEASAHIADELSVTLSRAQAPIIENEQAAQLFENQISRPSRTLSADDVATLTTATQNLELYVATNRRDAAVREMDHIDAISRGTLDAIMETHELVERLFFACLATSRFHLQNNDRTRARETMFHCRELGPDIEVHRRAQPPPVLALLDEVDADLHARPTHALVIETENQNCTVILDGKHVATTPATVPNVRVGEHRVSLACNDGRHSRYHRVVMVNEDRTEAIHIENDATIRTVERIELVFRTAAEENAQRMDAAIAIGSTLEATDVLIATPEENNVMRIDRIGVAAHDVRGTVRIAADGDSLHVATAIDALRRGHSVDLQNGDAIPTWTPPHANSPLNAAQNSVSGGELERQGEPFIPQASNTRVIGLAFGTVGLIGLVSAWGVDIDRTWLQHWINVAQPTDPDYQLRIQRRDRTTVWPYAAGIAGSLLTSVGIAYLLPDEPRTPTWAWVIGGAGVATAAAGGAVLALTPKCDSTQTNCPHPSFAVERGALLFMTALPMLIVPATYLIRSVFGEHAPNISVDANASGAFISFRGAF